MLTAKKMETKKIVLYFTIIGVMLSSTAFFVYKNHTLTSSKKYLATDVYIETVDVSKFNLEALGSQTAGEDKDVSDKSSSRDEKEKPLLQESISSSLINLDVLAKPKFKRLQDNFVELSDFNIGKRNPFQPYE